MNLDVMHLKHFPRLKVPQWVRHWHLVGGGVDICEINISYDNVRKFINFL